MTGVTEPASRPIGHAVRVLLSRQLAIVVAAVAVVSAVVVLVVSPGNADGDAIAALRGHGCAYDTSHDGGRRHVDRPAYAVEPPAGGDHLPKPAAPGVHDRATTPPDGELVHAMEHGLVVVWRGRGGATDAQVAAITTRFPDDVVVVHRDLPPGPQLWLTAWHRRLACPSLNDAAVTTFVCAFRGRGPERITLPRGGGCPT